MSNEASCILDVEDCQVLIDSQLHDCLLVEAPLLTGNEDEEKPHEAAEPEETAHDDDGLGHHKGPNSSMQTLKIRCFELGSK